MLKINEKPIKSNCNSTKSFLDKLESLENGINPFFYDKKYEKKTSYTYYDFQFLQPCYFECSKR